jgi:AsmA protein
VRVLKWVGGPFLLFFVAAALFFTFGLNTLRGPISRAVTTVTGRELLIEGDLKPVWSWVHPRIRAEGVSFANADWGKADYLLKAEAIEATISVLPLLIGRLVLPDVHLQQPEVALELDAEGRRNWILKKEPEEQQKSRIAIKLLTLDQGRLSYDDAVRNHSIQAELSTGEEGVTFSAKGKYKGLAAAGSGRGGPVLALRDNKTPYPLKAEAKIGKTTIKADGTITNIVELRTFDLKIDLKGETMATLYDVFGIAFPRTSPYTTSGRLVRDGNVVRYENFSGKVGESDLAGTMQVNLREGKKRPFMQGDLTSKVLSFADLGPLVGTTQPRKTGVLPDAPFDPARWDSVDADVKIRAGTIKRPEQLPLDKLATRIQMRDKVLSLNPLEFGTAGGRLAGTIRLDGNKEPIRGDVNMRVQNLQLAKLFPTVKQTQGSIGDLDGLIELSGSGNSVGKLLGSANGKIGVFIDSGQISQFLMELVALDLWDATRVKLRGDKQIDIRCAIADFGVKNGVMEANALVFDTTVVNIGGGGSINLTNEEMNLTLKPEPKDSGVASLRTPLHIRGTFSEPDVGPDMRRLAAKGAGAIALGILNPLLAVLPLIEEGKGKDSPCAQLIAQATSSSRSSASGATARRPPSRPTR